MSKPPSNLASVARAVSEIVPNVRQIPSTPTAEQVANYNRCSGHPMSNHMQADGTIVPRPLGDGK